MIGTLVNYSDEYGVKHSALVTAVHGDPNERPSVNLVYVSADPAKKDQYGSQLERRTSVVHKSNQSAHGLFYSRV